MRGAVALALACVARPAAAASLSAPWVLIDTHALSLSVVSARDRIIARFRNIAIGSGGAAPVHFRGDDTTPLGSFHVAWIDHHSRFGIFFGLDYPTPAVAARAYLEGRIQRASFDAVIAAFRQGRLAPQHGVLGGAIGIHGVGTGAAAIQRAVNWTDGCVAVTNREARELAHWIGVGTTVVIR